MYILISAVASRKVTILRDFTPLSETFRRKSNHYCENSSGDGLLTFPTLLIAPPLLPRFFTNLTNSPYSEILQTNPQLHSADER